MLYFLAGTVAVLTLFVATGNFFALSHEYAQIDIPLGGRAFHVRPAAKLIKTGSRLGVPLFEMQNELFVIVTYKCTSADGDQLEMIKDDTVIKSSDVAFHIAQCGTSFLASLPMSGEFTLRLRTKDGVVEGVGLLRREATYFLPFWRDMSSI